MSLSGQVKQPTTTFNDSCRGAYSLSRSLQHLHSHVHIHKHRCTLMTKNENTLFFVLKTLRVGADKIRNSLRINFAYCIL